MSNILIVANGKTAEKFIEKITLNTLSELNYTIVSQNPKESQSSKIEYKNFDATSLYRLRRLFYKKKFLTVFLIMQSSKETKVIYENIRTFNKKIRIVALDNNGILKEIQDNYLNIVDANELLANRLYQFLPNVPSAAQNIGLNKGEIIEVAVPFASAYAFRHISSIKQINWKIAAIYRDNKLLLPTKTTMIKPRDRLLIVGAPKVLLNVYYKIRNKSSKFPEPYGKNFYLYLDLDISHDAKRAIEYIKETLYLMDRLGDKKLVIRIVNPNCLETVNEIMSFENGRVRVLVSYSKIDEAVISRDLDKYNIGLILISHKTLFKKCFCKKLYNYKKLVYIFGDSNFRQIKEAVVVNSDEEATEEIASVAFYIADALGIDLSLRDYNPEGDFGNNKMAVELFETLAHVHNTKVKIIQEKKNPIAAIKHSKNILIVIPFKSSFSFNYLIAVIKRKVEILLLRSNKHPKLLTPTD